MEQRYRRKGKARRKENEGPQEIKKKKKEI